METISNAHIMTTESPPLRETFRPQLPGLFDEIGNEQPVLLIGPGESSGYFKIKHHAFQAEFVQIPIVPGEVHKADTLQSLARSLTRALHRGPKTMPGLKLTYVGDLKGLVPNPLENSVFVPLTSFLDRPLVLVPADDLDTPTPLALPPKQRRNDRIVVTLPSALQIFTGLSFSAHITYDRTDGSIHFTSKDPSELFYVQVPHRWEDPVVPHTIASRKEFGGQLRVSFAAATDIGKKRGRNEDDYRVLELDDGVHLFVVADGLGGHSYGAEAAASTSLAIPLAFEKSRRSLLPGQNLTDILRIAIRNSDTLIAQNIKEELGFIGAFSTVAALVVEGNCVAAGNVGDSPIYLLAAGGEDFIKLSVDHTEAALNKRQKKPEREIDWFNKMKKNTLTQVIGRGALSGDPEEVHPAVVSFPAVPGDLFLIASDGLTNAVPQECIARILVRAREEGISLKQTVQDLIDAANQAGGPDNITAILVSVGVDHT